MQNTSALVTSKVARGRELNFILCFVWGMCMMTSSAAGRRKVALGNENQQYDQRKQIYTSTKKMQPYCKRHNDYNG